MGVDMTSFGLPTMSQQAAGEVKTYLARTVAASKTTQRQPEEIQRFLAAEVLPELRELHTQPETVTAALQRCPKLFNIGLISQAVTSAAHAAKLADSDADKTLVTEHVQGMCEPVRAARQWSQLQNLHDTLRQLAQGDPSREHDLCRWVGLSWSAAGGRCHAEGHFDDARTAYINAEKVFRGLDNVDVDLAHCLHGLGVTLADLDNPAEALLKYREAEELYRHSNAPAQSLSECLHAQGVALETVGKKAEATKAFEKSKEAHNAPLQRMFPLQAQPPENNS